ncbi:MAG: RepB family plasmid replication initiator protein, partial [Plesiomonas shigelloides]
MESKNKSLVAWHSNHFLKAAYSMTRDEKRVVWLCMSGIDSNNPELGSFVISVSKYAEAFGVSSADASKDIRGALARLFTRSITIY